MRPHRIPGRRLCGTSRFVEPHEIRTGYKVIRVPLKNGVPSGRYDDFLTGFMIDNRNVWGRPVGVTVAGDGALLVTEDGHGTVWRVTYEGETYGKN